MKFPYSKSYCSLIDGKVSRWWPMIDLSTLDDKINNLKVRGYWDESTIC